MSVISVRPSILLSGFQLLKWFFLWLHYNISIHKFYCYYLNVTWKICKMLIDDRIIIYDFYCTKYNVVWAVLLYIPIMHVIIYNCGTNVQIFCFFSWRDQHVFWHEVNCFSFLFFPSNSARYMVVWKRPSNIRFWLCWKWKMIFKTMIKWLSVIIKIMGIDRLFDCIIIDEWVSYKWSTINLLDLKIVDRSIDKCCLIFNGKYN